MDRLLRRDGDSQRAGRRLARRGTGGLGRRAPGHFLRLGHVRLVHGAREPTDARPRLDQAVLLQRFERLAQGRAADAQLGHQFAFRGQLRAGRKTALQQGGGQLAGRGFSQSSVGYGLDFYHRLVVWWSDQTPPV